MLKSSRPFRSLSVPAIVLSATLGVMLTPTGLVLLTPEAHAQRAPQWQSCTGNPGGDWDQQIRSCSTLIQSGQETRPKQAVAYNNRGIAYALKGDPDRAIADFTEAIRLDPKSANTFNSRCWARAVAGRDLAQALADCNELLRLSPDDARVLNSRGLVQFKLGAFDRAIADYSAAIAKNAKDAGSLYARGVAKLRSGDTAAGEADIAAAKAIKADIATVYASHGVK